MSAGFQSAHPDEGPRIFTLDGLASEFGIGKHAIRKYIENGHVPPAVGKHPNGFNYTYAHYLALASIRAERDAVRMLSQSVRVLSRHAHCVVRSRDVHPA